MRTLASRIAQKHTAAQPAWAVEIPITAITSWAGKHIERHKVFVIPDPYNQAGGHKVSIDETGGNWYAKDFLKNSGRIAIDYGQDYWLDNADDVRKAVRIFLDSIEPKVQPDPYNLEGTTREFTRSWKEGADKSQLGKKLRFVLEAAVPFVTSLFGESHGGQFEAGIQKFRTASTKEARSLDVLDTVLPQRDILRLTDVLGDVGDVQAKELVLEVYKKLQAKLSLGDNEQDALVRLLNSVQHIGSWDAQTQRINIFKAASLLKLNPPSYMVAADRSASTGSSSLLEAERHLTQALSALREAAQAAQTAQGMQLLFDDRIKMQLDDMADRVEVVLLEVRPVKRSLSKWKIGTNSVP